MRQKGQVASVDGVESVIPKLTLGISARSSNARTEIQTCKEDSIRGGSVVALSEESRIHLQSTPESRFQPDERPDLARHQAANQTGAIRMVLDRTTNRASSSMHSMRNRAHGADIPNGTRRTVEQAVGFEAVQFRHEGVVVNDSPIQLLELERTGMCWPFNLLLKSYAAALETRPLISKCITSAVIGGLGDVSAQGIHHACGGHPVWYNKEVSIL